MAYKALYNKYRPQTFEEVAGQRAIVRTLRNAINNDKIAHAYLFCGPRGTGKTSMARLFAKALNCEQGLGHQCNECENCTALNHGSHPDVVEIDGASNNGVDQVRELIDQVRYSPIKGRYKIYIIDEVHMMSQGAFNALLKTLEEPPEHVVFILATTEPFKVLPTILSRCQRYDFGKIDEADIKAKLSWILQQENVPFEDAALDEIVTLADGGMRDALSILDQALAYGGNELKEQDVLTVFGLTSITEKANLLRLISSGDVSATLEKMNDFFIAGIDIRRLSGSMLDILKDLIIYNRTKNAALLAGIPQKEADDLAPKISVKRANQMITILLKAQRDFKTVSNIRSLFELTILQMVSLFGEEEAILGSPAPQPIAVQPAPIAPAPKPEPAPVQTPVNQAAAPQPVAPKQAPAPAVELDKIEIPEKMDFSSVPSGRATRIGEPVSLEDDEIIKAMVLGAKYKEERRGLREKWSLLNEASSDPRIGTFATLLHDGSPFCLCDELFLISYNYAPLAEQANLKENREALNALASILVGRPIVIYAINREETVRCQNKFFNLQPLGKLPKAEEIHLHLPQ